MSSSPGSTLEAYLMWAYDLIVDDDGSANVSLSIAEALGNTTRRITISNEEFGQILTLYEPYRKQVEDRLDDFDEENQSWRTYAGYAFEFIPETVDQMAENYCNSIKEQRIDPTCNGTDMGLNLTKETEPTYLLEEGDVIQIQRGAQLLARIPKHFVKDEWVGDWEIVEACVYANERLDWLIGPYIVVKVTTSDKHPNELPEVLRPKLHVVECELVRNQRVRIEFAQIGSDYPIIVNPSVIGKATKKWTVNLSTNPPK